MKAKNNINYRTSIGEPAKNHFKVKYKLSFETKSDLDILEDGKEILADMLIQDITDYLLNNYGKQKKLDKQHLLNDLIIFKSHRDELEMNLKRKEIATNLFASFITVVAAIFAVVFAVKDNIPTWFIVFAILMLFSFLTFLVILIIISNNKESEINKLKTVNNIIYILEEIKNERINMDKNFYIDAFNDSEKLKDTSSVKTKAYDKSSLRKNNKNKK